MDHNRAQLPVLLRQAHLDPSAGALAFHQTCRPGLGQGRKQVKLAVQGVALHQHLGDAGRKGEIPVHLERGVAAEEVQINTAGLEAERATDQLEGVVAVAQPGPQVDLPAGGPAGPLVAANLERLASGGQQVRRGPADLVAGIEGLERFAFGLRTETIHIEGHDRGRRRQRIRRYLPCVPLR